MDVSATIAGLILEPILQSAAGDRPIDELGENLRVAGLVRGQDELLQVDGPRIWRLLGDTQNPFIGIRAAERLAARGLGLVECVARTSATFAEAVDRGCRFVRLLSNIVTLELVHHGDVAAIVINTSVKRPLPWHGADFVIASLVLTIRRIVGADVMLEPCLVHAAPTSRSEEYDRVLGCAVRFMAGCDEVQFPAATLARRLASADTSICGFLERYAGDRLAALPTDASAGVQLNRAYVDAVERGDPAIHRVGRALAMSPRTLQRRLRAAGTSHREMVDATRRDLALGYLRNTNATLETIAERLGYSESSTFARAFRRWTGVAPSAYRSDALGASCT